MFPKGLAIKANSDLNGQAQAAARTKDHSRSFLGRRDFQDWNGQAQVAAKTKDNSRCSRGRRDFQDSKEHQGKQDNLDSLDSRVSLEAPTPKAHSAGLWARRQEKHRRVRRVRLVRKARQELRVSRVNRVNPERLASQVAS